MPTASHGRIVAQQLHELSTKATFTPALAASPYRHRNHPGRPRVGHLHGSPSARATRWCPRGGRRRRRWCPRLTPALNKATMGTRGQSGWQSQRWKRHGAPSSNASARHKSATRSIGSDIRAAYNGCSRLPDIGGLVLEPASAAVPTSAADEQHNYDDDQKSGRVHYCSPTTAPCRYNGLCIHSQPIPSATNADV